MDANNVLILIGMARHLLKKGWFLLLMLADAPGRVLPSG
jgi:hypothetical protein